MGRKPRKKYSAEKKLQILKDVEKFGLTQTCRKYNVYHTTIYTWQDKYEEEGFEGLKNKRKTRNNIDPEIKELRKENGMLKELLAERDLELKVKTELLKKSTFQRK